MKFELSDVVVVGERSWVGIGAVVSNNLTVCADCMIGAGAVVVNGISRPGTYIGIPARSQVDIIDTDACLFICFLRSKIVGKYGWIL